ncbi:hypothetical protein [Nocardia wallacei]|uniref:hypothetical protein n=1 Tax=Nocardia wallacei TaxID=480035 RepID=UPI002453B067|nr:hypothetical protein [Nocardia wallacei]
MSSHLVFQLYCRPAEAEAVRSALVSEIARFPEFGNARIEVEQKADADYEMHLTWAQQHPGVDPADRDYFLLSAESPTDIPDQVLAEVDSELWDWIGSTFNDASDEIVEVQAASSFGTQLVN